MKTKKTPEPESATFDQASALHEEKKKITRSPEYEEARLKKEIRVASELHLKANDKFKADNERRVANIRTLKDELESLQSKMATDAQPTLL